MVLINNLKLFLKPIFNDCMRVYVPGNNMLAPKIKPAQTSITIAINADEDRTLFTTHKTREYNFSLDNHISEWVYLTSLGKEWKHVYSKISEKAKGER